MRWPICKRALRRWPLIPDGHWILAVVGSVVLSVPSIVAAQGVPDQALAPDLLEQQVGERSAAISADSKLNPTTRDAALARLKEAQQLIQAAAADRLETTRLAEERHAAPATLAGLAADESKIQNRDEPVDWSNLSLPQLEMAAAESENLALAARQTAAETRQHLADLKNRRPLVGTELAAARQAVADARKQTEQVSAAGEGVTGTGSDEILARAREQALEARLALLEEQRNGADVREQWLDAQASAAEREAVAHDAGLRKLRNELGRRRLSEAVALSSEWRDSPVGEYGTIAALARSNLELAGQYAGQGAVFHRLEVVQRDLARLERVIADFENDAKELRARLDGLGRTFAAGTLIAQGIEELPSAAAHQASLDRRRVSINELQLRIVALARELRRLERDLPGESALIVSKLPGLRAVERDEAVQVVSRLLEARIRVLQPLLHDLDQHLNGLVEMQARETALLSNVQGMKQYLRSREPWVRNSRRVTLADLPAAVRGVTALPSPRLWAGGVTAIGAAAADQPEQSAWAVIALLAAVSTLAALRRWRRRSAGQGAAPAKRSRPGIVLGMAVVNGLACAATAVALGWWLAGIPAAPVGLRALGVGLLEIGMGIFAIALVGALFAREGGIGSVNAALGTIGGRVRVALWHLVGILGLLIASRVLIAAAADGATPDADVGARLCLLVAALLMGVGLHRALGWRLWRSPRPAGARGFVASLALYALAVAIPVVFAVLLVQGFTLAAFDLVRALIGTLLVLVIAGTVRALFLSARSDTAPDDVSWFSLRHGRADVLHLVLTLAAAAVLLWVWRDVVEALDYLRDIPLWTAETVEGLKTVTVANLLSCLAVLGGTLLTFWALPLIFARQSSDATQRIVGTRYAMIALVRYVVLIVGMASAFSLLNIGWSKLQWMAAGLSVGLGFGLQETVANFFSGVTLLSERSVRVGDTVTVGDKTGVVTRIRMRATTLHDSEGREVVIPNKELVTTQVTNWTLADTKRRLQVVVGVDYGSDTGLVQQTLLEAARTVDGVLTRPPPEAAFERFGDRALQFRLYVWIDDPGREARINHDLHVRINHLLVERGIGIASQKREVRLIPPTPVEAVPAADRVSS